MANESVWLGLKMDPRYPGGYPNYQPQNSFTRDPETNSEFTPENGWLEDDPLGMTYFQGLLLLVSGRVSEVKTIKHTFISLDVSNFKLPSTGCEFLAKYQRIQEISM